MTTGDLMSHDPFLYVLLECVRCPMRADGKLIIVEDAGTVHGIEIPEGWRMIPEMGRLYLLCPNHEGKADGVVDP